LHGAVPGLVSIPETDIDSILSRRAQRLVHCAALAILFAAAAGCGGGGGGPSSFAVTASAGGGGSITPPRASVGNGATATFSVASDEGYIVASVTGCGGTLDGSIFSTGPVTAACTVTASFAANSYSVDTSSGGNGTIEPSEAEVDHGAAAIFVITADDGFLVESVTGCGGEFEGTSYTTGPITAACTISATFRRPSVSGFVSPAAGSAVDSDVNDPLAPYASNDELANAQLIPNPVTVGGYVNQAERGPDGRSFMAGDELDVFRTGLLSGQTVTLWIASADVADDLDLLLADMDGNIVDASVDAAARVESLTIADGEDGEYYVIVHAWAGASNYLLTIGHAETVTEATVRLSDSFVTGEAIVRFAEAPAQRPGSLAAQARTLGWTLGRETEVRERNALLGFDALATLASGDVAMRVAARAYADRLGIGHRLRVRDSETAEKLATLYAIKELHRDTSVEAAVPNLLHRLDSGFVPNDTYYVHQWHYPQISLPGAWDFSTGLNSIVAVIDSGVLLDHPDLQGQLVPGYDFLLNQP
jgi:serine protease